LIEEPLRGGGLYFIFITFFIVGGRAIKLNIVVLSKFKMLKEAVFRNFCDRQATTGKHLTKMTGKRKNVNKKIN
jgi:hypothetical protein